MFAVIPVLVAGVLVVLGFSYVLQAPRWLRLVRLLTGEPERLFLPATGMVAGGIAIGHGGVAIEVGPPALKPGPAEASVSAPAAALATAGATSASDSSAAETPAGQVAFAPGSAELPVGIDPELEQVLATARTQGALIRIVGEADAAALALDRARAVAIALVRLGARAGDLDMSLARHASGDQARLLLAAPAGR